MHGDSAGNAYWTASDGRHSLSTESHPEHRPVSALPPPHPDLAGYHEESSRRWVLSIVVISSACLILAQLNFNIAWSIAIIGVGILTIRREVESIRADFAFDVERKRGLQVLAPKQRVSESVEWLNSYISALWPVLDPTLFAAGNDLLEDALKSLSPKVVRSVRIEGVSQGNNPLRLLGIRHLPESVDITARSPTLGSNPTFPPSTPLNTLSSPHENEEGGTYVNFEVEFSYRRRPPTAAHQPLHAKPQVPHFLLMLGLGVKHLVKFEVPVWVELAGLHGKVRLRLQVIPEPPFVRHVCFSFPSLPAVELVARPLKSINIMNFPGISPFVLSSVNAVISKFVAPSSYTIDMSRFFLGSDVQMKTKSHGIVCIVIHSASKLAVANRLTNTSNPYIVVSYENSVKELYRTRILEAESNPSWEEMCFLRLSTREDGEEGSRLKLTLMDYNRYSGLDEAVGFVEFPLVSLEGVPGVFHHQAHDPVKSFNRGDHTEGRLNWSAAFFPLAKTIPPPAPASTLDEDLNDRLHEDRHESKRHKPLFADRSTPEGSVSAAYAQRMREMLDGRLPANYSQRSGVVAFQIHQLSGLECDHLEGNLLPSSFCRVYFNDERKLQTVVKPLSAAPFFNVAGEEFCADWTGCEVTFVVMDAREGHQDVIIGMVTLELRELFSKSSQSTKWYDLTSGHGHGRARISLLFKSLAIEIAPPLRESNVGTLEITSLSVMGISDQLVARLDVAVEEGSSATTGEAGTKRYGEKNTGAPRQYAIDWPIAKLQLAVVHRNTSPVVLKLSGITTLKRRPETAEGLLWLSSLNPGSNTYSIPLYPGAFDTRPYGRTAEDALPLPSMPLARVRRAKGDRDSHLPAPHYPSLATTTSVPDKPFATLQVVARWIPGITSEHAKLELDEPQMELIQQALEVKLMKNDLSGGRKLDRMTTLMARLRKEEELASSSRRSSLVATAAGNGGFQLEDVGEFKSGNPKEVERKGSPMKFFKAASRKMKGAPKTMM